ncbi:MAG: hypothetical protein HOC23_02360 [Halieaceae bacterium]|jgi:hypothetical protein|nr:hypothetical protein [Halieaceae bacterium]
MSRPGLKQFFQELASEILAVTWTLYKLMIPTLLAVKLLQELGALVYLSWILSPLMTLVGLPESMGIVWATTLMTNIYAGFLVLLSQAGGDSLSVAQVTVLSTMLLVGHGLPVEARIAQYAGIKLSVTILTRVGGGLLFGWLLHCIYSAGDWLQQPNEIAWTPVKADDSLQAWIISQLQSLAVVFAIIVVLLSLLKLLRLVGVERLLELLLAPFLRVMGIGREATTITIVGMTLGLAFGGGLLIREAEAGHVSRRDIFSSLTLLALCHSLIEDTLIVLLIGAHISGVLWLRIVFTLIVLAATTRWLARRSDRFVERYLFNSS